MGQTFTGTQSTLSTNDTALSTAAPPSTEPVLVPPRIFFPFFFYWYSTVIAVPQANVQTVQQLRAAANSLCLQADAEAQSYGPHSDV